MPDQSAYSKKDQQTDPTLTHRRVVGATSFITSLKPIDNYLVQMASDPTKVSVVERADNLFRVVNYFWGAVRELNPQCFEEANSYVMLKTPGLFSLHHLMLRVMKDMMVGKRDWTQPEFVTMLEYCNEISKPEFWATGEADGVDRGDAAKYGSMKGFAELGSLLYESLKDSRP